jgi:hypothetical protein
LGDCSFIFIPIWHSRQDHNERMRMRSARLHRLRHGLILVRRRLRASEAAFIVLAALVGAMAGISTLMQSWLAHGLQHVFYGVTINRLSALASIRHPWRLLALPLGALALVGLNRWLALRGRTPSTWWRPMRCMAGAFPCSTI